MSRYRSEQFDTVSVLVARVVIREMTAQVALAYRAQDSIRERMRGNVSVGMAAQSMRVGNFDTANNEPATRFERMEIKALADPETHGISTSWPENSLCHISVREYTIG